MPLAVTLCSPAIYEAHYSTDRACTFFHSSSYTANPIACAAASANLELWRQPQTRARVAAVAAAQERCLDRLRYDERFSDLRRCGTITALDLHADEPGYLAEVGPKLQAFFRDSDVLLRPLGHTIYVMPPYCVTAGDVETVYAAIDEAVDHVL